MDARPWPVRKRPPGQPVTVVVHGIAALGSRLACITDPAFEAAALFHAVAATELVVPKAGDTDQVFVVEAIAVVIAAIAGFGRGLRRGAVGPAVRGLTAFIATANAQLVLPLTASQHAGGFFFAPAGHAVGQTLKALLPIPLHRLASVSRGTTRPGAVLSAVTVAVVKVHTPVGAHHVAVHIIGAFAAKSVVLQGA